MKYKIIIKGGYGFGNFGDDALLYVLHEYFSNFFSKNELAYSGEKSNYLTKIIGEYDVVPNDADFSNLTEILMFGGGTQFYSFDVSSFISRIKFSHLRLIANPAELAKRIKYVYHSVLKKYFKKTQNYSNDLTILSIGIGLGPFYNSKDRSIELNTEYLFKKMDFIAVRDLFSLAKCQEWDVNANLYSDICYYWDNPLFKVNNSKKSINKIGIIVRDWKLTEKEGYYNENLLRFSKFMLESGKDVSYFVFSQLTDSEWIDTLKKNNIKYHLWNPKIDTFDSYISLLSEMDLFITARYHGAIFSTLLNKPFITINIEPKLSLVNELFNNASKSWEYPYKIERLVKLVEEIDTKYPEYIQNIIHQKEKQIDLAKTMFSDFSKLLNIHL